MTYYPKKTGLLITLHDVDSMFHCASSVAIRRNR